MQLFWQCAWIWYPINSIEWHMVIFAVVCDFLLRNWRNRQFIFFFQNLHLFSFPTIYSLPCFPLKWRRYKFFSRRTPTKVRSNLKKDSVCHECGTKKRVPNGSQNHDLPYTGWVLITTELLGDSWWARSYSVFATFVVTHVLHTARISNVKRTICDNKERKMVNFKLWKK